MNKLPLGALQCRAPKVQEKRIAVRERIGQSLDGRLLPQPGYGPVYVCMCVGITGVGSGGGHVPPTFERGGGQRYVCAPPPHFQAQNLGLGIEPTDICDVTLAWLASRCWAIRHTSELYFVPRPFTSGGNGNGRGEPNGCWARQMCPPPPHILSRSYAVVYVGLCCK